jgi:hypothetical protein
MRELVVLGVGVITILAGIYEMYRSRTFRLPSERWGTRSMLVVVLLILWLAAAYYAIVTGLPR